MKVRCILTVDEIRDIIADKFHVSRKDVNLNIVETYSGYGINEYKDHAIECIIDTTDLRESRSSND